MARYDRIARLDPPARDDAFPGWLALRDLQGRERATDLGRRARLRFLAVRLVHRLNQQGDHIDRDSLLQQANALREELGQLPNRDPERRAIADFIDRVTDGNRAAVVEWTMELADAARSQAHPFAAEEYLRTAIELAEREALTELRDRALRRLAQRRERATAGAGTG